MPSPNQPKRPTSAATRHAGPPAPPASTAKLEGGTTKEKPKSVRRKVVAVKTGYYDHVIRNPGDVFIQDDAISPFSDADREPEHLGDKPGWMRVVSRDTPTKITGSNDVIRKEHDRIMREKIAGGGVGPDTTGSGDEDVLGLD